MASSQSYHTAAASHHTGSVAAARAEAGDEVDSAVSRQTPGQAAEPAEAPAVQAGDAPILLPAPDNPAVTDDMIMAYQNQIRYYN